jgi:PAS domain S-box-containing protein
MVLDVTLRRRQEERLRESEALYRTALETTSDGISIIDVQAGRYLYANQRLMNTIGRPAETIVGQPVDIYLHPDDAEIGRNKYREIRASGKGRVYYELRALKPDGSIVMMGITATETIYQGKDAIISFVSDVTEQRRTEEALRESEELYRTAMEKTNDGISIVQDGKYVYANQRLLKTLGREGEDVVNQPLGVYMDPDSAEMLKRYFIARIQGKEAPASYDVRIMKPDASYIMLNVRAAKITYKGKPATISFVTNVTERRLAEEALRQSEERYRTIFESIDDDYFETNLEGVFTFLNRPVSWTQFGRDELIGTKFDRYVTPEMARKISAAFNTIYRENKSLRIPECEIILKDGTTGHLEMSVSLIRDAKGLPVGFRGVTRDVSDRFEMEVEHRKLMEQLHHAQKMEAIGTLAGGIAHDFNNLLMGIQGYTSLMMLEIDPSHRYFEQLKAVQALVQSGAGLTRQLLGFARAGRYEILATDLSDLLSKSINLFGRTRKEIRIFENYAEDVWTVEVDRGQIEQVLLNLFVNAWQAMPGGGSLYIETNNILMEEPLAKIYDLKSGRYVKISITDTGIGMDEKTRQRIFDPFFTTKEMGRGTGLGLASAYGIVKGHAGIITVYSEKGHGSTFNIYLPASSKTVARDESVEAEPASGLETILLVDDEEVITDVTGRLLRELGYTIKTAANGEEAIKIYAEAHADIDLVIIDMIMPGISGSDTFDRLKAINPSIRAILSSGYSLNGKAQDIMNKGVRAFLQKPYRLSDLARKIREVLAD